MAEAGRAFVDIRPDLSGFGARLTAGVMGPLNQVQSGVTRSLVGSMKTAGALAAGALGVGILGGAVKSIVGVGIEYEKTLSIFKSVTQATATQMAKAQTTAQNLGNALDLPGVSAAGAAEAMTELAKAGLTTEQSIDAARGALQLSIAAQTDAGKAAEITANALLTFGLNAKDAGKITDYLAGAANASSASMTDIAYALAMGGTAAKQAGVPVKDAITAFTMLANAGIKGSDAGTLLKTALARMTAPTGKAAKTMKDLGLKFFDAKGNFVGMRSAVDQLQKRLGPLNTSQKAAALQTLFGADAMRFAGIAIDQGTKSWDKYSGQVGRSGQAAQLAKAQNAGLGGALDNLQSTAEGVGLRIYQALSPAMTGIVKWGTDIVAKLPQVAAQVQSGLGAIYNLMVKGDFTAAFRNAFHVEEDSTVVTTLLWIRDRIAAIINNLKATLAPIGTMFQNIGRLIQPFVPIVMTVAGALGAALLVALEKLSGVLPPVFQALSNVFGFLADHVNSVMAIIAAVGTFVAVLKAQQMITLAVTTAQRLFTAGMLLMRGAILSAQVAMTLLKYAFLSNPIGIIIAAVLALAAGIYVLWNRSETFRKIVTKVWEAVKGAVMTAVNWITGTALPAMSNFWNGIVEGAKSLWASVVGIFNNVVNAIKGFVASAVATGQQIMTAIATTFTNVRLAIGAFITAAVALGAQIINVLTYPFRIAIALVIAVFVWLWKQVGPTIIAFVQRVITGFQNMWARTVAIFNAIKAFLSAVWNAVVTFVTGVITRFVGAVALGWSLIWNRTVAVFNVVRGFLAAIWNAIAGVVTRGVTRIAGWVSSAWSRIYGVTSSIFNRVRGVVSSVWSAISSVVSNAVNRALGFIRTAWNNAYNAVSNAVNRVKTAVSNGFNAVVSTISGMVSRAVTAATNLGTSIWNAIKSAVSNMASIGADIVNGLINGIVGMGSRLWNAITGFIASNVPEPVKKLLGIASPSKLFITLGRFVTQGLIIGLTGSASQVRAAGLKMVNGLVDLFRQSTKELRAQGIKLSEAQQASLVRFVNRQNTALQDAAKRRDAITKQLAAAQTKLANLQKQAAEFRAGIRSNLVGSITDMGDGGTGPKKATDIVKGLQDRLAKVKKFQADMATLAKRGLNADYLQQIAAGGLDNADTAAALASGTTAQLQQVNTLQKQIGSAATSTAASVTNSLYGAGISAAQGLVAGLQSQKKQIETTMLNIAKGMQKAIKTALGIKSPSKVMAKMGVFTGMGLANGIDSQAKSVRDASAGLARASLVGYQNFAPGSVPNPQSATPTVRVFIGDRELTDIVRTEVDTSQTDTARQLTYGRRV